MATDERKAVAKLVLLEQACCDARLRSSHHGVLAVIFDHCYDNEYSYPGPARIAKLAGLNTRTVRRCIDDLEANGYLKVMSRGVGRPNWYWPAFEHASTTGSLTWIDGEGKLRVYRPDPTVRQDPTTPTTTGLRTLTPGSTGTSGTGPQVHEVRAHRPTEAVLEAVKETIKEAVGAAPLSHVDWAKQRREEDQRLEAAEELKRLAEEERKAQQKAQQRETVRAEYLQSRETNPKHAKVMERLFPKDLADLIEERAA